jgi:hypothetical protein
MQKIIFCEPASKDYSEVNFNTVNNYLKEGWQIVSVTPQFCSNSGGGETSYTRDIYGGFAVVISEPEVSL